MDVPSLSSTILSSNIGFANRKDYNVDKMMERATAVKSMENVVRMASDENAIDYWFADGVADGDIGEDTTLEEIIELGYCEDTSFQHVLNAFGWTMHLALKGGHKGSFYCQDFIS